MTAATLHVNPRSVRREHKAALWHDVLWLLKHEPSIVWTRAIREESLIVGQVGRQPLLIIVALPQYVPTDSQLAMIVKAVQHGAVGFVAHELREVELYLRRMAK